MIRRLLAWLEDARDWFTAWQESEKRELEIARMRARHYNALADGITERNGDLCCRHGVALDVHCCGCHSGFIFDLDHDCEAELEKRRWYGYQ